MKKIDEPGQRRFVSIPTLTAWLSVCILAAAWGRSLDDRWQVVWTYAGSFGLTASLGLSLIERSRIAHRRWMQDRVLRSRVECGLARLSEQGATLDSIHAAIRRLNRCADRLPNHSRRAGESCLGHTHQLSRLHLEIAPVEDYGDDNCELAVAIPGSLREISSRGVCFSHVQPFIARVVLLTFTLPDGDRLSFVVDVLWTEPSGDEFVAGGMLLAVGVPDELYEPEAEPELAEVCSA